MNVAIVGRRIVDFTSKTDGKKVHYVELHINSRDEKVEGLAVQSINTSLPQAESISVPNNYQLFFEPNSAGKAKLVDIVPLKA